MADVQDPDTNSTWFSWNKVGSPPAPQTDHCIDEGSRHSPARQHNHTTPVHHTPVLLNATSVKQQCRQRPLDPSFECPPVRPQSRLAKARNEGSHPDVPHPAQHPFLSACFGIAQTLPTAILVLGSITVLQNTKINRRVHRNMLCTWWRYPSHVPLWRPPERLNKLSDR